MKNIAIFGYQLLTRNKTAPTLLERLATGVELVCPDDVVIVCGKGVSRAGVTKTEAGIMKEWLVANNVKCQEIIQENNSNSTLDNLIELDKILRSRNTTECTIVTSDWHLLRCRYLAIHLLSSYNIHWVGAPGTDYENRIADEIIILNEYGFGN